MVKARETEATQPKTLGTLVYHWFRKFEEYQMKDPSNMS